MFFTYSIFQDTTSLDALANDNKENNIIIQNGIFNHLNITKKVIDEWDTEIPIAWDGNNTILNATFKNTLDGGKMADLIGNVYYLAIQRKEHNVEKWITLQKIFKNAEGLLNANFTMFDTTAENDVRYTYQLVPIDYYGNYGVAQQIDIVSHFNDAYICDTEKCFKITYEYKKNQSTNQQSAIYEPYGSKFPFAAFNAVTKYSSGTITAVLLAETSKQQTVSYLDRKAQIKLEKEFNNWLTNGKPKILKDFNGECKIIIIPNAINNEYYKELANGLASTSFDYVEIGEFTQESIDKLGITNSFPIQFAEIVDVD